MHYGLWEKGLSKSESGVGRGENHTLERERVDGRGRTTAFCRCWTRNEFYVELK